MHITGYGSPERDVVHPQVGSKERALKSMVQRIAIALTSLVVTEIFDCLVARERLGSTGIGYGIANPHGGHTTVDRPVDAFVDDVASPRHVAPF